MSHIVSSESTRVTAQPLNLGHLPCQPKIHDVANELTCSKTDQIRAEPRHSGKPWSNNRSRHAETRAELLPCVPPTLDHGDVVVEVVGAGEGLLEGVEEGVEEGVDRLRLEKGTLLGIGVLEGWDVRRR